MGSRAMFVICRDEAAARKHIRRSEGEIGVCYTRTGRRFFDRRRVRSRSACSSPSGDQLGRLVGRVREPTGSASTPRSCHGQRRRRSCCRSSTPRSARRQPRHYRLRSTHWNVRSSAASARTACSSASVRGKQGLRRMSRRTGATRWLVESVDDMRVAPFHCWPAGQITSTETTSGTWRRPASPRQTRSCSSRPPLDVEVDDPASEEQATAWWEELTAAAARGWSSSRRLRGARQARARSAGRQVPRARVPADHLRAGLHGTGEPRAAPERGLGAKRALALREFALGLEALERFVRGTALPRPRMRLRGPRAGERAGRSAPLGPVTARELRP